MLSSPNVSAGQVAPVSWYTTTFTPSPTNGTNTTGDPGPILTVTSLPPPPPPSSSPAPPPPLPVTGSQTPTQVFYALAPVVHQSRPQTLGMAGIGIGNGTFSNALQGALASGDVDSCALLLRYRTPAGAWLCSFPQGEHVPATLQCLIALPSAEPREGTKRPLKLKGAKALLGL